MSTSETCTMAVMSAINYHQKKKRANNNVSELKVNKGSHFWNESAEDKKTSQTAHPFWPFRDLVPCAFNQILSFEPFTRAHLNV